MLHICSYTTLPNSCFFVKIKTWLPNYRMNFVVSSIIKVSMDKIELWINVSEDDWTAVRVINLIQIKKKV